MISNGTPPKIFVLDFGIAKLVVDGAGGNATLTGQGTWLGTPGYMAPEQWSADGAGPASDRYALGVMAFELLTGKLPFQAATLPQMMEQHFRAPVPALSASGTLVDGTAFDPVIARAMAKDPDKRFATARELVSALRDAAAGKRTGPRGKKLWLPAAAGIAVLGMTVGGVVIARDSAADKPAAIAKPAEPIVERDPHAGFSLVSIVTRPEGAKIVRLEDTGERTLMTTPAKLELRSGQKIALAIRKPGYLEIKRELTPARAAEDIQLELQPLSEFAGVWTLPDGQLRELARNGDHVDVYKRKTVTGSRELWRKFAFVDSQKPGEVTFAAEAEMTAEGGASPDPSCRLTHRIEYHYDLTARTLDVQAERIEVGKRPDGGCYEVRREPGPRKRMLRVDGTTTTTWTEPPVVAPIDKSLKKEGKPVRTVAKPVPQVKKKPPPPKIDIPAQSNNPPPNEADLKSQAPPPIQQQQDTAGEQNAPNGDSQVAPPVKPQPKQQKGTKGN